MWNQGDIDTVSNRLDSSSSNTTVLAPLNSEVTKLPRKPWEDPKDYESLGMNAYDGQGGEDRAHQNLRRFVEAHIVPESPWDEGQKVKTLGGNTVWWENKDGKKVVCPDSKDTLTPAVCLLTAIHRFNLAPSKSRVYPTG